MALWEHLRFLLQLPAHEHDITETVLARKDRQNFEVVMRCCSSKTRAGMRKLREAGKSDDTQGTEAWLETIWMYLLAFFGRKVSNADIVRLL